MSLNVLIPRPLELLEHTKGERLSRGRHHFYIPVVHTLEARANEHSRTLVFLLCLFVRASLRSHLGRARQAHELRSGA